jgi:hypothetical protein
VSFRGASWASSRIFAFQDPLRLDQVPPVRRWSDAFGWHDGLDAISDLGLDA